MNDLTFVSKINVNLQQKRSFGYNFLFISDVKCINELW